MPLQGNTYTFEDLSGAASTSTDPNPYNALIDACNNDPAQVQARYDTHRTVRSKQQRELLLSPDFPGVNIDSILASLLRQERLDRDDKVQVQDGGNDGESMQGFVDPRHNLTFWARPPQIVREMIGECQRRLKETVPDLWLMPLLSLHMTALEITHSRDPETIASLTKQMQPLVQSAADFTYTLFHGEVIGDVPTTGRKRSRTRLVKPRLTFDAAAVALTWLPAAEEGEDEYTYHHLRRDLWEMLSKMSSTNLAKQEQTGTVKVESRYIVPSAHLTIARCVNRWDAVGTKDTKANDKGDEGEVDHGKVRRFVEAVDGINEWLEKEDGLQWIVGVGKGLELRAGACWYGGGESVYCGKGF